jgi:glycosyltransferase involved in cell wall biosynthesis
VPDTLTLSIIITSYTTERINDIYELLDSIKMQSYPHIETIYVAEQTRELIEKISEYAERNNISNIKVLFNDGEHGLSAARNIGLKTAKGEIIAFVDDDVVLYRGWAEGILKAHENDKVIGVTGPAFPLWENDAIAWFPKEFYWIISCTGWGNWSEITEVRNAWGMNMSFKKEAFKKAGDFITSFGLCNSERKSWRDPPSEDVDLSMRIKKTTGKIIIFHPDVKVKHRVYSYRIKQQFVKQRSYSVGYQRRMIKILYKDTSEKLLNQENQLLKRIITRLFPDIIKNIFTKPAIAYKKARVTFTSLFFVALGYYSFLLPGSIINHKK